jgi:hypothetical protein
MWVELKMRRGARLGMTRKTPINKMGTGKLAPMLMVEDIAMISIGMNYMVVHGMVIVSSSCKRRCLILETDPLICICIMPSMRVL